MKFTFSVSPNLRQRQSTKRIMLELMIALLAVFGFSLVYYGSVFGSRYALQAVLLLAVSLAVAMLTETAFAFFTKKEQKFDAAYLKTFLGGSFGWITAIILTLMCPISIPPYALGVATFFAIFFAKLLFGGFGNNIFNPAAVGRAVIFATFVGAATDVVTGATPTTTIASEYNWLVADSESITYMMQELGGLGTLFTGWYPGAIGETSVLVILIAGAFLIWRKVIDWRVPLVYLGSIFVLAACIALFKGVGSYGSMPGVLWYPLLHVLSGGVVFGAVFMLTDPVTSPTSAQGRCIFALGAAIITVLIRIKANLPEGCLYSILIMNMLTPMIEKALEGKQLALRKKALVISAVTALVGVGSVLVAANVISPKAVEMGNTVSSTDQDILDLDAKILEKKEDGSRIVYTVQAQGYYYKEQPELYNTFVITVDKENKELSSIKVKEVNDSDFVKQSLTENTDLKHLKHLDLSKETSFPTVDVVSGATYTTKSVMRALMEVQYDMGWLERSQEEVQEQNAVVTMDDEEMAQMDASILDTKEQNGLTVYTVQAQGYYYKEKPDVYNVFEITVDTDAKEIRSMKAVEINDSDFVKQTFEEQPELKELAHQKLDEDIALETPDVVSGATYTTRSALRAIVEVQRALGL